MISIEVEDATVEVDSREITITRKGSVVSTTLTAEQAVNVMMALASSFPPPPGLCGSGPNSCEGCDC